MPRINVEIPTSDGMSTGTLHLPDGAGPWPGVLVFTDIFGTRDAFLGMGDRLAGLGYAALVPDVYYREEFAPFDMATVWGDEAERKRLFGLMQTVSNERIIADSHAYADFLLARPEVRGTAIGAHGYCMGGRLALVAAGGVGEKFAAAASFHAGHVALQDDPNSAHLGAPGIRAKVYVAGSKDDAGFTADHAGLLGSALTEAGVQHTIEFYDGAHGFAVPDQPVYNEAAAERHWAALEDLYGATL